MSITMKQVLDGIEPIMRILDRPIPLATVLKNGSEQILCKYPMSGIMLHSKVNGETSAYLATTEYYLVWGGSFLQVERRSFSDSSSETNWKQLPEWEFVSALPDGLKGIANACTRGIEERMSVLEQKTKVFREFNDDLTGVA